MNFSPIERLEGVSKRSRTLLLMALGVAAVALAGVWDAQRQDQVALAQLASEHHLLAVALATRFESDTSEGSAEGHSSRVQRLLAAARNVGAEGQLVILLKTPERAGFLLPDGRVFASSDIERALERAQPGITLTRDVAADLGLKPRVAVAGLSRLRWPRPGLAGIAVVGSASRERDRQRRDQWRIVLTTALVSALILGFGSAALRRQRRELELERQVAVHRSQRERDTELARADRMAAIAALSSGIAHEISTPLGIISGRLEELNEFSRNEPRATKLLASISAQVERIHKVIRGFLALARGDAPTLSRVSAQKLADEAAQLVKHRFSTASVELRVRLATNENRLVSCEPALFEQVLVNLLINALEASEAGQVVELCVEDHGGRIAFSVIDEGSGITEAAIAHATEPFFTTKARKGGSGLGLAIAREIVAHHRGELRLERRRDVQAARVNGTRATVTLPESL